MINSLLIFGFIYILIWLLFFSGLPNAEEIKSYRPPKTVKPSHVNWDGNIRQPVYIWAPLHQISILLRKAVVVSEDDRFYYHNGVNFEMMKEAFSVNWTKKRYVRGASTITMQLARNAFLHKKKTLRRKIREIILARRIEKVLSKQQILELYLNIAEWGKNIYGAEAAARFYFEKPAAKLNLAESTLLAGMLPNPKYFNPFERMRSCKRMQKRVLWLLQISRHITEEQVERAYQKDIRLRGEPYLREDFNIAVTDSSEESKYLMPVLPSMKAAPRIPRSLKKERFVQPTDSSREIEK
ncbi:hypothetical protein GF337_20785 [candidate division KSB1 bacterium]|nr:hypothetical protein [candidate division KSB1 bacterium]